MSCPIQKKQPSLKISIFDNKIPQSQTYQAHSSFSSLVVFASKGYTFKSIFDFTTAGDWECVTAVERLPALYYSVDLSLFGS